jgi:deoxyribonuclease V
MKIPHLHRWDLSPAEARALQEELAASVDVTRPLPDWTTLAAADVSFDRFGTELYAAVIVFRRGTMEVLQKVGVAAPAAFPYVPGLLSFREIPALLDAFAKLEEPPDVVLADGQGIAHPRRIGIASHLGLALGLPTVGCAKSLLCGKFDEPGENRGDRSPLIHKGEVIGSVLRTKKRVKPLFISPGHLCDLDSAVGLVMEMTGKYRLPDPTSAAHEFVNEVRRKAKALRP